MVGVSLLLNALVGSVASGFFHSIALRLTRQKVTPEAIMEAAEGIHGKMIHAANRQ